MITKIQENIGCSLQRNYVREPLCKANREKREGHRCSIGVIAGHEQNNPAKEQPFIQKGDIMSKVKELADRFFDGDVEYCKFKKLTKEEIETFENFEWRILYDNGLKNINGGYQLITIYDGDGDYLFCWAECGKQDVGDGHQTSDKWRIKFNRKTKKFEDN